jgi:hypothetical protein
MKRLFMVAPKDIHEHPLTLPKQASEIPIGPIEGWEAYAPEMDRDPHTVIGPFKPVVERFDDRLCIQAPGSYQFWYDDEPGRFGGADRPSWYQSGSTLRFVKVKPVYVPGSEA